MSTARQSPSWAFVVTCGILLTLDARPAWAEPPALGVRPTPYLALGDSAQKRAKAERLARAYAAKSGLTLESLEAGPLVKQSASDIPEARLEVLLRAERALAEARELSAQLREAAALRVLAQAEESLLDALEIPGVHAFLAEIYLQLGLCAAQLGETGLFETALRRALSLDPRRRLEAAEAPPSVLAHARELGRAYDVLPLSEIAITPEPASAVSTLDGVELSKDTSAARVRSGLHVLVVRAPGHAPYASVLGLEPGRRAPLRVVLAPRADEAARMELLHAGENLGSSAPRARALAGLLAVPVLLFEAAPGAAERALVHRCEASRCELVSGTDAEARHRPHFAHAAEARAWLNADAVRAQQRSEQKPLWKRWPLWTAGAVLVLAGVTAAVWASRDVGVRERRELEIEPAAAPR